MIYCANEHREPQEYPMSLINILSLLITCSPQMFLSYKNQLAGLQSNQLTGFYIRGTFIANMLMWIKNERCEKMDDTFFVYIPFSYNMVVNFTWHNTHYKPFHRNTSPLPINRFSFCSSLHTM